MQNTPKERMLAAQGLYEKMQQDNAALQAFEESLKGISERAADMLTYYEADWLEDMEGLYEAGEQIEVMGEDHIYNAIEDQYNTVKRILLLCAQHINR